MTWVLPEVSHASPIAQGSHPRMCSQETTEHMPSCVALATIGNCLVLHGKGLTHRLWCVCVPSGDTSVPTQFSSVRSARNRGKARAELARGQQRAPPPELQMGADTSPWSLHQRVQAGAQRP